MDSLLEPIELNRETVEALDQIRAGAANALYGATSAEAGKKIERCILPLLESSDHPVPVLPQLRPGDLGAHPQGDLR